jgi:hypothetical protein
MKAKKQVCVVIDLKKKIVWFKKNECQTIIKKKIWCYKCTKKIIVHDAFLEKFFLSIIFNKWFYLQG